MGILNLFAEHIPASKPNTAHAAILQSPDIQDAAQTMLHAMRKSESILEGAALLSCFSKRLKMEKDTDGMFHAFRDMYLLYQINEDSIAMSIAQMLGEKLHESGHDGIAISDSGNQFILREIQLLGNPDILPL